MFDIAINQPCCNEEIAIGDRSGDVEAAIVWHGDQCVVTCEKRRPVMEEKMGRREIEKVQLTLYIIPSCPHCQKVLRCLEGMDKKIPLKNIRDTPQYGEELVKLGGKQQVPCLMIDDQPLYESDDIIRWLKTHRELY